jgi:hypothetical protein
VLNQMMVAGTSIALILNGMIQIKAYKSAIGYFSGRRN